MENIKDYRKLIIFSTETSATKVKNNHQMLRISSHIIVNYGKLSRIEIGFGNI
jgi:hypothetical protein